MELLIVALLSLLVVTVAAVAVALFRRGPNAGGPAGPSIDEITARVQLASQQALTGALEELSRRAQADREETSRLVTTMVAQQSGEALANRANAIDATLQAVRQDLTDRLTQVNAELGRLRESSAGQFTSVADAVTILTKRTENLNEILSSAQRRGQWGERLAEDMIRHAGLHEGVNYTKQQTTAAGGRPDFTFTMPPDRLLFMDVKFPLDRYAAHLAAEDDATRASTQADFVRAVRGHVDTLARRDYIDQSTDNAIDYVLMFVPNESISGFVHESDPDLIDWALQRKVVLCSPLTLYAFLVVVRQATDSFHTEQTASSIMQEINKFDREFGKYVKAVDEVHDSFRKLDEKLTSIGTGGTRFRKVRVPVKAIEQMRRRQGIPELPEGAPDEAPDESVPDGPADDDPTDGD